MGGKLKSSLLEMLDLGNLPDMKVEMLRRLLETWNDNYGTGGAGEVKYLK